MELKKNSKIEIGSNSSLYFAIGLNIMLFITYSALEYKTYDRTDLSQSVLQLDEELDDDIPITEQIKTPPPPPSPRAHEIITIVDDIQEIEETVIESTEMDQDESIEERIMDVEEVEVAELDEDISVPFSVVEKVPIFPGCNGKNNAELRTCFQKKMQEHLIKNFQYPERAMEMGVHGKVYVWFEINKDGIVSSIKTRGPDKSLEKEAARIIGLLPKMIPGKQRGRSVKVPYSIPINFRLEL